MLPEGVEPGLEASTIWDPPNFTYPSGTHVAVVEVVPDTGEVKLERLVAVTHMVYDDSGQCLTASLMDYAAPKPDVLPSFELDRVETLSPVNPLGAKGCGEAGTIGSTPAVVNAVLDALSPLGVTHIDMPLTPARVWAAIQSARRQS